MKAVRIHQYGGREVLSLDEIPVPDIAPDEVLVRVVAASINPVDWKVRAGYLAQMIPHQLPLTLGWDVSGVVVASGSEVTQWQAGDAVYSRPDLARNGTYAEFVAIRANECARKPRTISHVEAASLPLAGITAWEAMMDTARVRAGQRVLVHAGSGGVGSLAIQLVKAAAATVIATASGRNRALVESLGVDQFVDYTTTKAADAVEPVDAVFDTIGGEVQEASWSLLKPGGIQVSIINPPDACIMAIGGINEVPVVQNGQIVPGHVMKVTLSCDHRVVDGAVGAKFLQAFKPMIENPVTMLA